MSLYWRRTRPTSTGSGPAMAARAASISFVRLSRPRADRIRWRAVRAIRLRPGTSRGTGYRPRGSNPVVVGTEVRRWRALVVTTVAAIVVAAGAAVVPDAAPAAAGAAPPAWQPEPATFGVGSTSNVGVTMADGTVLRVDVYYPTDRATGKPASGPFPVLLTQTPYGKESLADPY